VADIKALKWETIGGLSLTEPVKQFWRPFLQQPTHTPLADRVQLNKTTFYVTPRPYTLNQIQGTAFLCFHPRQQVDSRDWRRQEIVWRNNICRQAKPSKPACASILNGAANSSPRCWIKPRSLMAAPVFATPTLGPRATGAPLL
jgi:hypothetical protein